MMIFYCGSHSEKTADLYIGLHIFLDERHMYPTCSNRVAWNQKGEALFYPPLTISNEDTDVFGLE